MTQEDIDKIHKKVMSILNEEFLASKDYVPKRRDWLSAYWTGFKSPEQPSRIRNTGYDNLMSLLLGKFPVVCIALLKSMIYPVQSETRDFEKCRESNNSLT